MTFCAVNSFKSSVIRVKVGVGAGVREWITMNASQQAWVYFIDRSSILTCLPNLHPHPSQPNYPA